jgi:thiamine kinase
LRAVMSLTPGPVLGNGREAVVYALDDERVLKVFRDVAATARAQAEFSTAAMLHSYGLSVAMPLEITTFQGRPALISRRVRGRDLNATLARAPWKLSSVASQLAQVQLEWHRLEAPAALPSLHAIVAERVRSNTEIPVSLKEAALVELDTLPRGERLCHGNSHLGNVLVEKGRPVLIDCSDASRGDPLAEVAHTLVRYRCARLRPGAPPLARVGATPGGGLRGRRDGRADRRGVDLDDDVVARWVGVRAVERLAENHAPERHRLLQLARRNLRVDPLER